VCGESDTEGEGDIDDGVEVGRTRLSSSKPDDKTSESGWDECKGEDVLDCTGDDVAGDTVGEVRTAAAEETGVTTTVVAVKAAAVKASSLSWLV